MTTLGTDTPHKPTLRIHLPEWRDSYAVTQQVAGALNKGIERIYLSGARGDRLLLAGLTGPWSAEIRIDGDLGTELAREVNAPSLFILANGNAGAGAGYGLKGGTLAISGSCGALLGSGIKGGEIWALAGTGTRLGHRASGGRLVISSGIDAMAMDRRTGGTITFRPFPHPAKDAQALLQKIEAIRAWPQVLS